MLVEHEITVTEEIDKLGGKKKRGNPERLAQVQVISYLRRALPDGNIVFAIVNEQRGDSSNKFGRARFGQARKASGVLTGVPDICCIIPGHPTVWIEMKSSVGRLTDMQRDMHRRIAAAGQVVGVVRSIEDAIALMDQAGVPLRFRVAGA